MPALACGDASPGLSEQEIELVQVDPLLVRLLRSGASSRRPDRPRDQLFPQHPQDNAYAHPIEGVVAVVDLIAGKVADLTDADPIVPIPRKKRNYGAHGTRIRAPDVKPLHIEQPEGA